MGVKRNGAREFLRLSAKVCKLSRTPGFQNGLEQILGVATAADLLSGFNTYCTVVDLLVATDNWFNQKDHVNDDGLGEDVDMPA